MGVQVLPTLEPRPARMGLHVVTRGESGVEQQLPLELPRYLAEPLHEEQDSLGCIRGIAMALGLQAILVLVVFGLWKLLH